MFVTVEDHGCADSDVLCTLLGRFERTQTQGVFKTEKILMLESVYK